MLEIFKKGSAYLKAVAEEVPHGDDVDSLIDGMRRAMDSANGVGLAANQVGVLKRVVVMNVEGLSLDIINPVITPRAGGKRAVEEGCLSYPGKKVKMRRHKRVVLEGFDRNWNPIKKKLSGWASVCAQHEVDHLDGRTISS